MADVDVQFLGEQLSRVLKELAVIRGELAGMRAETKHIPTIAEEVAALGVQVGEIKESLVIIEHDLSGVKMRVERIERRTGLTPQ